MTTSPATLEILQRGPARDTPPRTAFLYCGQGSQTYQMARAIYDAEPRFRACLDDLDAKMSRRIGGSVLARLYDPERRKSQAFDDLVYSHPAIFIVELALTRTLEAFVGPADCLVGSSLGELTAAVVSEAMALDDAMDLIAHTVRELTRMTRRGGMLAVIAPRRAWDEWPELRGCCDLAADFGESHFVVSGRTDQIEAAQAHLERRDVGFIRLPVNHAFHSAEIDDLRPAFATDALGIGFRPPAIPVISCVTCAPVERFTLDHLWRAIREPLLMQRTVGFLLGLDRFKAVDLGPGSTFVSLFDAAAGLRGGMAAYRVLTPLGDEMSNFRKAQQALLAGCSFERGRLW
ncbi:MAG TPA: acyltransferase domain-containing protein [Caulobacteraceae bacterium]|jgi:trans-AT polyketide synthase/acyltransferase/oxidoreductase domain-containing protein